MNPNDLLEISKLILAKTREFIPYSSNKTRDGRDIEPWKQPYNTIVTLRAVRARKDSLKLKQKIKELHLDMSANAYNGETIIEGDFTASKFPTLGKNPTLDKVRGYYLRCLPDKASALKDIHNLTDIESISKNSTKFGAGNCLEHAATTFTLLVEEDNPFIENVPKEEKIPMEFIYSKEYDHCFVVLNRDSTQPLQDMTKWGKNPVIIDSWGNDTYIVAEKLKQHNVSKEFEEISRSNSDLHSIYTSFVGAGHSQRWQQRREQKKEPLRLFDWQPAYTLNEVNNTIPINHKPK